MPTLRPHVRRSIDNVVGSSFGTRLSGIEGLRALAASTVLVYHVWLFAAPGGHQPGLGYLGRFMPDLAFGVILFFGLSGFLLYRPFAAALLRGDRRTSFPQYLRNRALRILPAYWAILLITSFVLGSTRIRDSEGELVTAPLSDPAAVAQNAFLVQNYQPRGVVTGIGPAWSLAVEVVFYLTLPLLVLMAWTLAGLTRTRAGRRAGALAPAVLLLLVGLAAKTTLAYVLPASASGGWGTIGSRSSNAVFSVMRTCSRSGWHSP